MEVFTINVPIFAKSREEAESAQRELRAFVENYRNQNIAVTGQKIVDAMRNLQGNGFIRAQVDNFLRR